jgi:hypothetical protein
MCEKDRFIVRKGSKVGSEQDAAMSRATDAMIESITSEPVPPAIRDLALQLQAKLDAQRAQSPSDQGARDSDVG